MDEREAWSQKETDLLIQGWMITDMNRSSFAKAFAASKPVGPPRTARSVLSKLIREIKRLERMQRPPSVYRRPVSPPSILRRRSPRLRKEAPSDKGVALPRPETLLRSLAAPQNELLEKGVADIPPGSYTWVRADLFTPEASPDLLRVQVLQRINPPHRGFNLVVQNLNGRPIGVRSSECITIGLVDPRSLKEGQRVFLVKGDTRLVAGTFSYAIAKFENHEECICVVKTVVRTVAVDGSKVRVEIK